MAKIHRKYYFVYADKYSPYDIFTHKQFILSRNVAVVN